MNGIVDSSSLLGHSVSRVNISESCLGSLSFLLVGCHTSLDTGNLATPSTGLQDSPHFYLFLSHLFQAGTQYLTGGSAVQTLIPSAASARSGRAGSGLLASSALSSFIPGLPAGSHPDNFLLA